MALDGGYLRHICNEINQIVVNNRVALYEKSRCEQSAN